jgi:hypothetical protein
VPKQYEAIRDKFVSEGKPLAEAKTRAAKIYNAANRDNPVTNQSDKPNFKKGKAPAKPRPTNPFAWS